jgi:hypothetical protein
MLWPIRQWDIHILRIVSALRKRMKSEGQIIPMLNQP